jgi:hypothetical protein
MKDRDTLYRILQTNGMSCSFDGFVPGFSHKHASDKKLIDYAEQVVVNAKKAGRILEKQIPNYFGQVESAFTITSGQSGKVRGDVFEMLCRAIFWNCATAIRNQKITGRTEDFYTPPALQAFPQSRKIALVTLGDNYDLKALFSSPSAKLLSDFEGLLSERKTSISYSTPDFVCVDISGLDQEAISKFDEVIFDLSPQSQKTLVKARQLVEGKLVPSDILFAGGIKTSIRSDRMYQFLYEANAWKFLWSRVFKVAPSPYYVLTSQVFGADATKLASVDFSTTNSGDSEIRRAIDGVYQVETALDLVAWCVDSVAKSSVESSQNG